LIVLLKFVATVEREVSEREASEREASEREVSRKRSHADSGKHRPLFAPAFSHTPAATVIIIKINYAVITVTMTRDLDRLIGGTNPCGDIA